MKVKHGKSQEITDQLSEQAAIAFAQWIGCATVIYNQKTVQSTNDYAAWLATGANPTTKPIANQQVAYLCEPLPSSKKFLLKYAEMQEANGLKQPMPPN
jgi:hypothetical protein